MLTELKKFLMRGNVVDLAVAVVIGVAFQAVVNAFVEYIVNPLIAAVFGKPDIRDVLTFEVNDAVVSIGAFLQAVLDFLIIGLALFFVVQAYTRLQSIRDRTPPEDHPVPSDEAVLLAEIRDLLRTRP